jgi:hypothetical protein
LERLSIQRIPVDESIAARIAMLSKSNSPSDLRWVVCEPADMMREGPWTTRLYIFDSGAPQDCIIVEARDHGNGGVYYQWLNEKLLFVRCWWGRIVSTDLLLDAETAHPLYIEDANYFRLVYEQAQE